MLSKKSQQNIQAFLTRVMRTDNNRPSAKASRLLPNCDGPKRFFVCDGAVYANLYEMTEGLKIMHDKTFTSHVNKEKNDFMNWVRDVFGDQRLAKEIAKINQPRGMAKKVEARIKTLQKM